MKTDNCTVVSDASRNASVPILAAVSAKNPGPDILYIVYKGANGVWAGLCMYVCIILEPLV